MTFQVKLDPQVDKFLKKSAPLVAERIKEKLRLLKTEPFQYLEHYEGDYYKLRIGDYRALIDVDNTRQLIFVRYVDHRSRIYKRFQ